MQIEELEMTGTSQNEQFISTLAHVTAKVRIPQSLYSFYRLMSQIRENREKKWKALTLKNRNIIGSTSALC